jgi:hypothetical protein
MSKESYAISTVPSAPPTQGDYDAIRAAIMDSTRGRWFLDEFSRRNRNTDTRLVLEAIERIEAVIRGDRNREAYQNVRVDLLEMAKTIAATRAEVAGIEPAAALLSKPAESAAAAPAAPDIFAAAERIQEVAWAMRERGLDPSMCGQIDTLAASILSASSLRNPADHRAQKLGEVLQYLERRINTMLDGVADARESAQAPPEALPAPAADGENRSLHTGNGHDPGLVEAAVALMAEAAAISAEPEDAPPAPEVTGAEPARQADTVAREDNSEIEPEPFAVAPVVSLADVSPSELDRPPIEIDSPIDASTAEVSRDILLAQPLLEPSPLTRAEPALQTLPSPAVVRTMTAAPVQTSSEPQPWEADLTPALPDTLRTETAAVMPVEVAALAQPTATPTPPPALSDPLAALKAMSEEERIALFT